MRAFAAAAMVCLIAGQAWAGSKELHYGPPADWIIPPPAPTDMPAPAGAPLRVIHLDTQIRIDRDAEETYSGELIKILSPDGLALGNVAVTWNPSTEDVTVHKLQLRRGDQVIDVLAANKFQIIQRENNLDYAMLDGKLTATLQIPGVQVGDEVDFAVTTRRHDLVFGERPFGTLQLPVAASPGAHRARFVWRDGTVVNWRVTPDLPPPVRSGQGGQHVETYELRDPKSSVTAEGAPPRFNVRRLIEYSAFSTWSDISQVLWPLYDKASTLAPDSPIRQEAARIAAASKDPTARAEAALALVQDRIRYVYVGLDDGNYRPESADDTWSRRFGDCKAKTVLLVALLRELGIAAEAALVDVTGGDGTDERLPSPGLFNHVVVRASIGGKTYWLDGTRLGDRRLALLPPSTFRWALPLRKGPVELEKVIREAPSLPDAINVLEVDATGGYTAPAKVSAKRIYRGEGVFKAQTTLSGMTPEDANRVQDAMWRDVYSWVVPSTVEWRYDEQQGVIVMSMTGEGKLDWLGDDISGHALDLFNAGFPPPTPLRRPKEQDQSAPWATNFPSFSCSATTIRLPASKGRWRWEHDAAPINRKVGGIAYWRQAGIDGDVFNSVVSLRTYLPELSAAQAQEVNDKIPSFNKYVSRAFQNEGLVAPLPVAAKPPKPVIDWSSPSAPCAAPEGQAASAEPPAGGAHRLAAPPPPAAAPAPPEALVTPEADVDTEPKQDPLHPVTQPEYPAVSVWSMEEGAVILNFVVKKDGTVNAPSISIRDSSGFPALDAAAIEEAARWRFLPATKKGKPVAAKHVFRVVFELKRRPSPDGAGDYGGILGEIADSLKPAVAIPPPPPPLPPQAGTAPAAAKGGTAPTPDPERPITQPPYPADARAARQEGDVILQFTVEADGFVNPASIVVKKSSGVPSLDKAAVNEASVNWRFRPATMNGKPVAAQHRFRVVFSLEDADRE